MRREGDAEGWLEMKDELEDDRYSFDATVLPDGLYRFRVTVSDERGNDGSEGADRDPHQRGGGDRPQPAGGRLGRAGRRRLRVVIEDSWNIVREAVWSADVSPWENARVDDGLLDSRRETLVLEPEKGAKLLLLRLTDAAYNVFTYDLSQHLEGRR